MLRILAIPLALYFLLLAGVYLRQRSLLFFPSHHNPDGPLKPWINGGRTIGYCREVTNATTIWLMTHGNAGQASDRDYVLACMSTNDSLYVLEYPGYGNRPGEPALIAINKAATEAYQILRRQFPSTPICVLGESIGTGPASMLSAQRPPPDKIILIVPYDSLASVAAERFWFLPVRFILRDAWDNGKALRDFKGPVEIFGASHDQIIPVRHAESLAKKLPGAKLTILNCAHNDWAYDRQLRIER